MEGDSPIPCFQGRQKRFLSTPSGWRATKAFLIDSVEEYGISIHALRVEGDHQHSTRIRPRCNFYPRPPGGGRRRERLVTPDNFKEFLSTPSGWRATLHLFKFLEHLVKISIHALRVEGDVRSRRASIGNRISIHALRVEGDFEWILIIDAFVTISIHALRVEGDSKNGQNFRLFLRKREKNLPL